MGSTMYLIEGPEAGFTSIPRGMYWAIVTMTTVGYGNVTPQSVLGQTLAAILMITGYAIIAVPTGIVSAELVQATRKPTTRVCPACTDEGQMGCSLLQTMRRRAARTRFGERATEAVGVAP